jgi:2-polyprenyl-3-methyl-5-hydroxy-6-metoxy-1,4-benzoquinol methylase
MHILQHPKIWKFFRILLEATLGIYRKRVKMLYKYSMLPSGSLLEIGCGTGDFSTHVKGEYVGVDIDERYINHAKKLYPNRNFFTSLSEPSIQNRKFDSLLMMDVVHHLPDDTLKSILVDVKSLNITKKVIFDPIKEQSNWIGSILCSLDRGKYIRKTESILNALKAEGFEIEDVTRFKLGPTESVSILFK